MKKFIVAVVLLSFVSVGCTGSFLLTKKVYNWHRGLDGKWADEFGFLVCSMLPIYGLSTLADSLVFNSIEFWTGKNPVNEAKAETQTKIVRAGDEKATMTYNAKTNQLTIASQKKGLHPTTIVLEKNGDTLLTKDQKGQLLSTTVKDGNGGYLVYNKDQKLVRNYSSDDINSIAKSYIK